ncbi:MAG: hypothetical protein DDT32_00802 [Syntrophomonadaceae bacterium]|nr:hypothetical protein [Bacillota bacterium]MBT9147050.1 hypothetical protein [Bacillota bacterium]
MIKERLKKIIKIIGNNPEKVILWFFILILVAMSSYLVIKWRAKEAPDDVAPVVRRPLEAPVLVDFGGLIKREGYYRERFPRDPFSHQPLVPDPVEDPVEDPALVPDPVEDPAEDPIIRKPRPRLTRMMTIGGRRVAFIRIGRETHQVTGGESINGWKVLNIREDGATLYNEKRGQRLTLFIKIH